MSEPSGTPHAPAGPEVIAPDSVSDPSPAFGSPSATAAGASAQGANGGEPRTEADEQSEQPDVESPAKIIRIGAMVKQMLEEVRGTELDQASREQIREIYERSIAQLKSALSPDLGAELEDLSFDFAEESAPSEAELRMAKAQLVGWLEGLFHGIQATLMAQQMAARQQLEGMRAQIPERTGPPVPGPGYI